MVKNNYKKIATGTTKISLQIPSNNQCTYDIPINIAFDPSDVFLAIKNDGMWANRSLNRTSTGMSYKNNNTDPKIIAYDLWNSDYLCVDINNISRKNINIGTHALIHSGNIEQICTRIDLVVTWVAIE